MTTAVRADSVTFTIPQVPLSRNANRSHVAFGRGAAGSRHGTTMEWRRLGELYGSQAMIAARWPKAEPGDRFRVEIVMHRRGLIRDRDNKLGAAKDLVDSLCRFHRVRIPKPGGYRYQPVDGLGMIFDDSDLEDGGLIDLVVRQVQAGRRDLPRTVVTVERLS